MKGHAGTRAILVAVLSMAALFPATRASASGPQEVRAVLGAKTLPGRLDVVGVVLRRDPAKGTFALADRADCGNCRGGDWAPASLPVRWKGTLPGVSEAVRVKGPVSATKEGKFLVADSVEKVSK